MTEEGGIQRLGSFVARRYWILLIGLLLVGCGLRIATYHGVRAADPSFHKANLDSRYFLDWADRIVGGDPFGEREEPWPRPFFMNPLYPYFLSPFVAVFDDVMLAVRIAQVILGVLTILLVADATRRLVGPGTGLLAGLITAMYPLLLYYEQRLMIVTLAVFLNALAVWFLTGLRTRPNIGAALLAGFPLGLSVLARPNVILFAALLPLWFLLLAPAGRRIRFAVSRSAVLLVGIVLMTLPVTLRNLVVGKEFVWVTWSMGVNLWQSNNPAARKAGWMFSEELEHNPWLMEADAIRIGKREIARREIAGTDLSISEVDEHWVELTRREIARRRLALDHPAWKELSRERVGAEPSPEQVRDFIRAEARRRLAMRGIARREAARFDLASQAERRILTPREVRRYWSGREITEAEVDEYWGIRKIPAEDIERAWADTCEPGTEAGPDPDTVDAFLGDREPTPAELHELLGPMVGAHWERSGADPDKLDREVKAHWGDAEPSPLEVDDYWGERVPTKAQVEEVTAARVEALWEGRETRVSEISSYWSWRTRQMMLAEPGPAITFLVRKFLYGLRGFEMPSSYYFAVDRPQIAPLRWLPFRFVYLSPLMLLGCFLVLRPLRPALLFLLLVAAYVVGLTVFYPLAHYRAPMLPAAIPLAAIALTRLLRAALGGTARERVLIASLLVLSVVLSQATNIAALLGDKQFAGRKDDYVVLNHNRGMALLTEGRLDDAEEAFRLATAAETRSHYGWMGRAAVAQARGLYDLEALHLERALETTRAEPMSEQEAGAVYGRWRRLWREGRMMEAEAALWEAVREHKASVLPRVWLAQLAVTTLPPEIWRRRILGAMERRRDEGQLWALLGMNWFHRGMEEPGLLMIRQATVQSPDSYQVHAILADLSYENGDFEEALRGYRRAGQLAPRADVLALANQSRCHRMLGRPDDAAEALARGLAVDPRHPALRLERVLLAHGRGEAGLDEIRRLAEELRAAGETMPDEVLELLGE